MNKYRLPALLAAMLFVLSSCSSGQEKTIPLVEPVEVKYDSAVVARGNIAQRALYEGYVNPKVESVAFENRSGVLEEIYVKLGDRVKKGIPVAKMDISDLEDQIATARDNITYKKKKLAYDLAQKQYDIDNAQIDLDLLKSKSASKSDIEIAMVAIDKLKSEAEYISKNAAVDISLADDNLNELEESAKGAVITAPCDGEVVSVASLVPGDRIAVFSPIVYVADDSNLQIQYSGTDTMPSGDRVTALIGDKEYNLTKKVYSKEEYLSLVLEGKTPPTIFFFTERVNDVKAGDFAALILYTREEENTLYIPVNAIFRSDSISYVYKIVDGKKEYTEVSIGVRTDAFIEITDGLQEGDVIFVKQ